VSEQDSNWSSLAGIGLQIGVGVGLGCLVGWWLDKKFGWSPWGIVVGSMLGLAAGMYLMIKETLKKQG
jgi:F0F1-type ATP synthase assembly protein I